MQEYLLWEPPEGSLSILVRRSLLERLKVAAEKAFSDPDAETSGVLLGHAEDLIESGKRVITIENFESGVSGLHNAAVVGFARFRRQKALHLNEADFLLLRAALGLVCLMIRPDHRAGAVGGFFYREHKTVRCPESSMQFPLDSRATNCRGTIAAVNADTSQKAPEGTARRLVYAAVGLVLMLGSLAIWLVGR